MLHKLVVVAGVISSLVFLKFFASPYVWICISWFIIFLYIALSVKKSSVIKAILFNASIVFLTFGIVEIYFLMNDPEAQFKVVDTPGWIVPHEILGYAPQKNIKAPLKSYYDNTLLFDVVYTIDSNGLRISPPDDNRDDMDCVLFFGGSMMFGTGVSDSETMAYQTGIKTKGKYRVYNFGFRGYGPHQMLAALEHGLVDEIIECKPRYIIYMAINHHAARSAGLTKWDKQGPKYVLNKEGKAVYAGAFESSERMIPKWMLYQLKKSFIVKQIYKRHRKVNKDDLDLFAGIVDAARSTIEDRYQGSEFHVIFWSQKKGQFHSDIIKRLKDKNMRLHLIQDIINNFDEKSTKYEIKHDKHPNPLAHELLAQYVIDTIIGK